MNSKKIPNNSLTVSPTGPILLEDTVLHETLESFIHENLPNRVVHTKGYGAFGFFTAACSMSAYTKACFLQRTGQQTSTFTRFSLAVSNHGTPDTSRNIWGFSTKFYTVQGNFDLLCNHIPVFLVKDPINFPAAIKSVSPSSKNNLKDPNSFFCFVLEHPECWNFFVRFYSDLGTLDSIIGLRTYSVNTYLWENSAGKKHYVKYHWKPLADRKTIDRKTAQKLASLNPDIAGQELYDVLSSERCIQYELAIQLMDPFIAEHLPFDPLDDTMIWSEEDFPLKSVGILTLNRNASNYHEQVEKAAFSPANLIDGIQLSNDKVLQGRSFAYWDAQRYRLGNDFRNIPINRSNCNSSDSPITSGEGSSNLGFAVRRETPKGNPYLQAHNYYESLSFIQQEHLIDNLAHDLNNACASVQKQFLEALHKVHPELAKKTSFSLNRPC